MGDNRSKINSWNKHVDASTKPLRTGVQFPPPPQIKKRPNYRAVFFYDFINKEISQQLGMFLYAYRPRISEALVTLRIETTNAAMRIDIL